MTGEPPERFSGVWVRRGLVIGGAPVDDADVLWLQAGAWYADLRIPHDDDGGPVEAFAGPSSWAEPDFTWHHAVDWIGTYPTDVGHLAVDGENLIETGTFTRDGRVVDYRERWVRSGPAHPRLVAVTQEPGERAIVVRVGDHAIALTESRDDSDRRRGFTAQRWEAAGGGRWDTVFARGVGEVPPPRPVLEGCHGGEVIPFGRWQLSVIDAGVAP